MSTIFHKLSFAARLALLLAVVLGTFAVPATPAAARSAIPLTPNDTLGKFSVFVCDADSIDKAPLYGAVVSVYDASGGLVLQGNTDMYGWFSDKLEEGQYAVSVAKRDYKPDTFEVTVKGGLGTEAEIGLAKDTIVPKGILLVYTWAASSSELVPLPGAVILVLNSAGDPVAKGYTDKKGIYSVDLDAGTYTIEAAADGYLPKVGKVVLNPKQQTTVDLLLQKEALIGPMLVRVYDASANRLLPISGANIVVYDVNGQVVTKGITDKLGKYDIYLAVGVYHLEVSAVGYQSIMVDAKVNPDRPYVVNARLYKLPVNQ